MTCFHYKTGSGSSAEIGRISSCLISPNYISRIERRVAARASLPFRHDQTLTAHDHIALHHMRTHGAINKFEPLLSGVFLLYSRVHGLHPPAASSIGTDAAIARMDACVPGILQIAHTIEYQRIETGAHYNRKDAGASIAHIPLY
jgi:hypothetical protein